jgi:hypothetical protein
MWGQGDARPIRRLQHGSNYKHVGAGLRPAPTDPSASGPYWTDCSFSLASWTTSSSVLPTGTPASSKPLTFA